MDTLKVLTSMARALRGDVDPQGPYSRLLEELGRVVPYDAAAILCLKEGILFPLAARGLSYGAMQRGYQLSCHPRLRSIVDSEGPCRFPASYPDPDPFENLLEVPSGARERIRDCIGLSLRIDGRVAGVLTADSVRDGAFDGLDRQFLITVGDLAAIQMAITRLKELSAGQGNKWGRSDSPSLRKVQPGWELGLLGNSEAIRGLRENIRVVANSDCTVLVYGETGVGKELVVRAIHEASPRGNGPLVYLNCGALSETLAGSELFGHVRGAFTGAFNDRIGKFELANTGSLVLDEIGELPLPLQPKLLRAIQEKEVERLGSNRTVRVDVRLLASTNRNLKDEVRAGRFREDLYYRINVYPIYVPPLRERVQDVPILAANYCEFLAGRIGCGVRMSDSFVEALCHYYWPGNVRELENVLSRAILRANYSNPLGSSLLDLEPWHLTHDLGEPALAAPSIPFGLGQGSNQPQDFQELVDRFKRDLIRLTLEKEHGNWAAAARALGLHRSNLHRLGLRLGLLERACKGKAKRR